MSFSREQKLVFIAIFTALAVAATISAFVLRSEAAEAEVAELSTEAKELKRELRIAKMNRDTAQARLDEFFDYRDQMEQTEKFIINAMLLSKVRMNELKKTTIVKTLAEVAMNSLETNDQRELWVAVIANESKFNPNAKSNAGAIGIGQVMPGSADFYSKQCDFPKVSKSDLYDVRINALFSACIFKIMMKSVDNSPSLTLIAYNAGQWSKDLKRIDKLMNINKESANYVAKIHRFLERARVKGAPAE